MNKMANEILGYNLSSWGFQPETDEEHLEAIEAESATNVTPLRPQLNVDLIQTDLCVSDLTGKLWFQPIADMYNIESLVSSLESCGFAFSDRDYNQMQHIKTIYLIDTTANDNHVKKALT